MLVLVGSLLKILVIFVSASLAMKLREYMYSQSGMGNRIWSIYGSRSLARPYILQYCALTHCNDCNIRVAHVAIYCVHVGIVVWEHG